MVIGVDIGGSKTLVARFETSPGQPPRLASSQRFVTQKDFSKDYQQMVETISQVSRGETPTAIVIGSRGELEVDGRLTDHKILGWDSVPIVANLKQTYRCPVEIYNDAALATLAEAKLGAGRDYNRVFYCTISSGIGTGFAVRGELVLDHSGGGDLVVGEQGLDESSRRQTLEQLVSGSAILKRFGKTGREITDPGTWQIIADELALALNEFIVMTQPDIVVIGGGIGEHFDKYHSALESALVRFNTSQYPLPKIAQAKFVEDGVVYGAALKAEGLSS